MREFARLAERIARLNLTADAQANSALLPLIVDFMHHIVNDAMASDALLALVRYPVEQAASAEVDAINTRLAAAMRALGETVLRRRRGRTTRIGPTQAARGRTPGIRALPSHTPGSARRSLLSS